MRAAKSERSGDADGAERVQTVCIGECLILHCRMLRIPRPAGQPVVMLDARSDGVNFIGWKATAREKIGS